MRLPTVPSVEYHVMDALPILPIILVSFVVACYLQLAFGLLNTFMIIVMMNWLSILQIAWELHWNKSKKLTSIIDELFITMMRLFLFSLMVSAVVAAPMLNMVHKIHLIKNGSRPHYSNMISCTTCKKALQDLIYSHSVAAFSNRVPEACRHATTNKLDYIGCIQTLYQHRNVLFANQRRFIPSEASCYRIKAVNCRPVIIMCDQRKKKGYCHVITD
jgi:hypothetical protein